MNPLASTPPIVSAAADLARAAASPPEISRTGPLARMPLEAALAARGARAEAAPAPPQGRRSAPSRARVRPAVAGYAKAGAASAAAVKAAGSKAAGAAPSSKASSSAAKTGGTAQAKSDPLAFLHDPKLSVEEKLMRLLEHLNARWEKDMQRKLDEMAGHKSASGAGAKPPGEAKSTSLLGKIVDGARKFFPEVGFALDALKNPAVRAVATKIGGPVLAAAATALGFPALAPALLKYAPAVIDLAAGAASALDGGTSAAGAKPGRSASGASGTEESSSGLSDNQMKLKLMEIQRIQDAQKEMFAMVSNLLRSSHDLRMSVIGNLR